MKIKENFKKIKVFFIFLFFIFVFLGFVYSIEKGNPALVAEDVGRNQIITGYINLSLENESGNSDVVVKINNSDVKKMKLMDVIKAAIEKGKNFYCYYYDKNVTCDRVFDVKSSGEIYKGKAGDNYVGFVLVNVSEVKSLSFKISGYSNREECGVSPLLIDLFANNTIDYIYVNPGSMPCGDNYPKNYNESASSYDVVLDSNLKCANIKVKHMTGKIAVGGIIKLQNTSYTTKEDDIFFKVKTPSGDFTCNTTTTNSNYGEVSCDVEVFVKPDTYEVCVKASQDASNSKAFRLLKKGDYALFIKEYSNLQLYGEVDFNSTIYYQQTHRNLLNDIKDFIDKNCKKDEECIIPMYINSTQDFNLTELNLEYQSGSDIIGLRDFSSLSVEYPKIDSKGFQIIPLEVFNITSPSQHGRYELKIEISGKTFSDYFFVHEVPIVAGIFPNEALIGEDTEFRVVAYSPRGTPIVSYYVDWGDNSSSENSNGIFIHKYVSGGTYNVFVRVRDSQGLVGSGSFVIYVNITKENLNKSLTEALQKINEATQRLDPLILEFLNLNQTKEKLNQLLVNLSYGGDLETIKREFDYLKRDIPLSIQKTSFPQFNYVVDWEKIDMGNVEAIIGDCPYSKDSCKKGIALWNKENVNIRISGDKYVVVFYDSNKRIFTQVTISGGRGTVIVEVSSSNIKTYSNYNDLGNAIAFNLTTFSFVHDGDLNIYDINLYAVPSSFDEITIEEEGEGELYTPPKNFFWIIFLILILLLIIGLIIIWLPYIKNMLKEREKEKIKKIFPSITDYYNLLNFVSHALSSGENEKSIYEKLIKAGWKKEQVSYVIKEVKKHQKIKPKK